MGRSQSLDLGHAIQPRRAGDSLNHGMARKQSIVLDHISYRAARPCALHAILRLTTQDDDARQRGYQAVDHAERCRPAAVPDDDRQLTTSSFEREVIDCDHATRISLGDLIEDDHAGF